MNNGIVSKTFTNESNRFSTLNESSEKEKTDLYAIYDYSKVFPYRIESTTDAVAAVAAEFLCIFDNNHADADVDTKDNVIINVNIFSLYDLILQ